VDFRTLVVAFALVPMMGASPGSAAVTSFPFIGSAAECDTAGCLGDVKPFSGSFSVDPSAPDVITDPPFATGATDGVYIDNGPINVLFHGATYTGRATYSVFDNSATLGAELGVAVADGFFIDGRLQSPGGYALNFFGTLVGSDLDLFDSDSLPTRVGQLANASLAIAGVTIQTIPALAIEGEGLGKTFEGEMNVVPLPAGVVLFASGLAGLAALRRRARA